MLVVPAFPQHAANPALPHAKHKTVVIAHRGNHVNAPENTLASTREAIQCGADYVEVDLRTTKDGHLVAMHDAKVDRTTNGMGKIADMTWQEVVELQVFNRNKKTHRIPEFREILAICKGKINIYLDFKDADVTESWKQIKAAGMEHQVVVYLNKEEQYKKWREVAPEMPLMTSLPKEVTNKEQLTAFLNHTHIQVADNITEPELLKAAHELGIAVWLDVQSPTEGPASWNEALHKGVQGLQTDKPAEMVSYIKTNVQ
ncbi:glycerophosphoryl diester phosphodiesterase [Dyadobacter soli]|uniref:Glycerophosphoryl diester phosphodiesterase n=2 Tax=Dyadobacter soli TaxID=659014 RepID=A0A1G7QSE1_9BACT|nr:glycerophosphoryl diester phosphodiesterase [Dyadobacter soli]